MTYDKIKEYCINEDTATKDWFDKIDTAIQTYNNTTQGVSKAFEGVLRGLYSVYTNNMLVYSDDEILGIDHNAPIGSLENLWYKWEWQDKTEKKFYEQFQYEIDELDITKKVLSINQPFIDEIVSEILEARNKEKTKIENYADSLWEVGNKNSIIIMFEDRGEVLQIPEKRKIAEEIYIKQGIYNLAKDKSLGIYIPRYIRIAMGETIC